MAKGRLLIALAAGASLLVAIVWLGRRAPSNPPDKTVASAPAADQVSTRVRPADRPLRPADSLAAERAEDSQIVTTNLVIRDGIVTHVLRTNESSVGRVFRFDPDELEAARREARREDADRNAHQGIAARESQLKALAQRLKAGMTLQEVITVMGPAAIIEVPVEESPELVVLRRVQLADLERYGSSEFTVYYTPYPTDRVWKPTGLPYERLHLAFGADRRLQGISWY
jgi:hypothetical protein